MADAPEIKVKLTAEDAGVSAAIKELGAQLRNLKKTQDETASSSLSLAKAFQGIAVGAAALGLAKIGKDAFDSAISIGKMADKTGLSTQTLSVFHKVAEDVGASTENVDKALLKAAKSITDFQQGGQKAAGGFKILNLTAKDFAGLNSDQKIQLVTTRLGGMSASFQKAAAQAAIFGKGASDLTLVANSLAGQGFDAATKATAKLGLLLDTKTTDTFREAKASMQELTDTGKGMATQFEAGLLPAVSDVGEGLLAALGDDGAGASFKELGKEAGTVIKGIAFGLLSFGATAGHAAAEIEEVFDFAFNHTKEFAKTTFAAVRGYISGGVGGAAAAASVHLSTATDNATKEFAERLAAIDKDAEAAQQKIYDGLFPSDEEEEKRRKERLSRLRPDKTQDAPDVTAAPNDAAAKAALSSLEKQLQDELSIYKAYAAQTAESDKGMYDKGEISLAEYFDRRRTAVTSGVAEEIGILQKERAAFQDAASKAGKEAAGQAPGSPGQDKFLAQQIEDKQKVQELDAKITEARIAADTKLKALDDEQVEKQLANQKALLEFQEKLLVAQGKPYDAEILKIKAEGEELAQQLKKIGGSAADAEKITNAALANAAFEKQQKSEQDALQENADKRQQIENEVKTGQIFQAQGEQQIKEIEKERLEILKQIAAQLNAKAQAPGATDDDKRNAANATQAVNNANAQLDTVGQHIGELKSDLQGDLTSGFVNFFDTLERGNQTVAESFEHLAGSVIASLEKQATQMLINLAIQKLFSAFSGPATGGASAGASFAKGIGLFAEGGLIKGPGGPKDDRVPAMLSHGEFVVKADAVSMFGAGNLDKINRGLSVPSISQLALPRFAEGGLVGNSVGGGDSNINLGIELSEGLILKHLSSKQAGRVVLNHLANNPKAASKALGRSEG